jgi:hypothetical protein
MPFLLPGRAKVYIQYTLLALPCQFMKGRAMQVQRVYGENLIPIVVMEDEPLHTPDHPFCYSALCPCHDDEFLISEVAVFIAQGLCTPQEATDFVLGRGM